MVNSLALKSIYSILIVWLLPATACAASPLFLSTAPPELELRQGIRHESEHRAVPLRKYWLSTKDNIPDDARAIVLHPLGGWSEADLERTTEGIHLSLSLPMMDGAMHGVHNNYVVTTEVTGRELLVRVAKWITIHHSCSWGHNYKYVDERIQASHLDSIPLEIVCGELWDGNFHSNTRSGDTIDAQVLLYGAPVEGAKVKLMTSRGWSKELDSNGAGLASFQLIRDYYPDWKEFSSRHRDRFSLIAEYVKAGAGEYEGAAYDQARFLSTLVWAYSPSRKDFSSYELGLLIGALGLFSAGLSVAFYRQRRQRPYKEVVFDERD